MKSRIRPFAAGVAVAVPLVVGAALARQGTNHDALYTASVNRMETLVTAVLMYTNDYDDSLPLAHKWMDETVPYLKSQIAFHSPAVALAGYGYALNKKFAGIDINQIESRSRAILLFDSIDLKRNATEYTNTEPFPSRYKEGNTEAYADGSVKDYVNTQGPPALLKLSLQRVKQLALGNLLYSNDYDGYMAPASTWADATFPYVQSLDTYRSPMAQKAGDPNLFGYAYDAALGGRFSFNFNDPASTLLVFDSTLLYWNANDDGQSIPVPGRYLGLNTIAYLDGHSVAK